MAELALAIVGCGATGTAHLRAWAELSGVRIAAVCDVDGVAAARTAARVAGAEAYTRVRDLLASEPFDIVDVCLPEEERTTAAESALRAGANVLCQNPIALTAEAASALAQIAADRERLLLPAFRLRFHSLTLFAQELLESDDLGRPTLFRCHLSERATENTNLGAALATATQGIDLFRALCGEVTSITGEAARFQPDSEGEDTVAALLRSEENTLGIVEASLTPTGARNVLEIFGTAGACVLDYDLGTLRYLTADQPVWQTRDETAPDAEARMVAHFADAVRGLQPLSATGEDSVRAISLSATILPKFP